MTKRVIPSTDGRLIEVTEGELKAPPPAPPKPKRQNKNPRKKATTDHNKPKSARRYPKMSEDHPTHRKSREIPGYHAWWKERCRQIQQFFNKPGGPVRRRFGIPDGMRREDVAAAWDEARRRARMDMENIKTVMPNLDDAASEALENTLTIMRSPMNQDMQLKAARQVLEWTMAKPASKQEMKIDAAEAWLASIADDAAKANRDS